VSAVQIKRYPAPPVNRQEILRYALCREETADIAALLDECLAEAERVLTYSVCWAEFPVPENIASNYLRRNLSGCSRVIAFAATIGLGLDRLIARYGRIAPSKAVLLQAIGAERIESLCDEFQRDIDCPRPRFSPGYGDLPLDAQRDIFRALDCPRRIGLSLNDSLLMSPSKSVTALIGVGPANEPCARHDCAACTLQSCSFRISLNLPQGSL